MSLATRILPEQRFTKRTQDCPVCGGNADDPHGTGRRCWGTIALDGRFAVCTRPEHGGTLQPNKLGHYNHFLAGECACGVAHGELPVELLQRLERAADAPPPERRLFDRREPYLSNGFRKTREWAYEQDVGDVAYYVARYDPPEGSEKRKRFHPWQQVGKRWAMDEQGLTRILYRLPELRAAPLTVPVFIPEGEKCVEALRERGMVATTSMGGAGKWHLTPNAREEFHGRTAIIPADNDEPGRRHAEQVAQDLVGVAARIFVVTLPGLAEHGDIYDWLDAGGTRMGLYELVLATPEYGSTPPDLPPPPPSQDELAARRLRAAEERARTAEHKYRQILRQHVTEDRILRQSETNDGDKVMLIAGLRHLARKRKPEHREEDGSLLVCYGGVDDKTGRPYGLGALIGRSPEVAGERVRRLKGMHAWEIEPHKNWNGKLGKTRVTMRETWTGTHRPWTVVPNETTTRGKPGGPRTPIRVCQNPACRSTDLETKCRTCHTVQDLPPVYMDEAEINAARQPQSENSTPGRQLAPQGAETTHEEPTGQVTPLCAPDTERGNLPPVVADVGCWECGGEIEGFTVSGQPYCLTHTPQLEAS
jgi:hypothetical protein